MANERFAFPRSELRSRAARGAIINGAFLIAVESLGVVQAVVVARLLDADQVGLYGIVSVTVMTLLSLKQIGIDEAFVQQEQEDQVEAFQHAFTLDLALSAGFALMTAALAPLVGSLYGDSSLVPLMLALSLLPILFALQAPAWVFLRRMDFVRQRALQAIVPAVTLIATVAALLADLGAWSLVIGALTGNAAAAVMAAVISPYPLRIKLHGKAARRYLTFSAPIFLAAVCGLMIRQGQTFAFEAKLGLAGVGYLTLAVTLTRYADRADQLITQTIYPAICAIADKPARMAEAFEKSNRLTAMWALPFGAILALFTPDLIAHALGEKWIPATALIQLIGVSTAIYQLGFNWTAFHRAVGRTRPQTVYAIAGLFAFLAAPLPLLLAFGASGFGWGLFAVNIVAGGLRWAYMRNLLPSVRIARLAGRAFVPPLLACVPVICWRLFEGSDPRDLAVSLAQLVLYVAAYVALTITLERRLLNEALSYVRTRGLAPTPTAGT
ncbi:MAG: oligosaccharide flippase family protein [Actinomycetes bacterium]